MLHGKGDIFFLKPISGSDVKVKKKKKIHCGYAFIEYFNSHDFGRAYQRGDRRLINGRHVRVDVEKGRLEKRDGVLISLFFCMVFF
jgi:hypothetical protein